MEVIVRPLVPKEDKEKPKKEIKKAIVLCLNEPDQLAQYERLVNDPNVFVEKTETQFTPEGKYFVAVFYRVIVQGGD